MNILAPKIEALYTAPPQKIAVLLEMTYDLEYISITYGDHLLE
jgi:hypothetical protein